MSFLMTFPCSFPSLNFFFYSQMRLNKKKLKVQNTSPDNQRKHWNKNNISWISVDATAVCTFVFLLLCRQSPKSHLGLIGSVHFFALL